MMVFRDARDYQIVFLSFFLLLGISSRDWTVRLDLMLVVIVSCLLTQMVLSGWVNFRSKIDFAQRRKDKAVRSWGFPKLRRQCGLGVSPSKATVVNCRVKEDAKRFSVGDIGFLGSWRSALITGLGLCLLLRANSYQTMALAGCLAIASKFLFNFQGKHFFNPANFGIISALIFTPDAWVSPGQWGTDWWYLLLFLGAGGIVLKKVGRWDTSAAFLLSYTGLEIFRNCWLGWSWDVLLHQLMSGSLLLFALFMLTDPRSIPNATVSRLIWAIAIAILTFIFQHIFYLSTAIFWALFIVSPLTLVLDYFRSAPRFSWKSNLLTLPS